MKRAWQRLAALGLGLSLSLVMMEVAVRLLRPGEFATSILTTPEGEKLADLSSVIGLLQEVQAAEGPSDRVRTALTPGEVVLGCYDRPRWDYFDANGCVEYRMNSLGFRDLEFPQAKPAGERRIIAIGDSFTFGVGVQLEGTWAQQLERGLSAARDEPVQVINAGYVAGHMPPDYQRWIRTEAMKLEPDVVIVGLCLNDLGPIPMMAYDPAEHASFSRLWTLVDRHLRSYRVDRALSRQQSAQKGKAAAKAKRSDFLKLVQDQPGTWKASSDALLQSKALLEQRGVRFVVAVLPMVSELHPEGRYLPLHELVMAFAQKHGIEAVDCGPPFMGKLETDLWAHPTDQHPNAVGQALLARTIQEYLLEGR